MVQEREPFEMPGDDPVVKTVMEAHRIVTSQPAKLVGKRIVGDANLYVNLGGIPAFYYGPANETSHSNNEWVSIWQIEQAAKVYALTAAKYCGISEENE